MYTEGYKFEGKLFLFQCNTKLQTLIKGCYCSVSFSTAVEKALLRFVFMSNNKSLKIITQKIALFFINYSFVYIAQLQFMPTQMGPSTHNVGAEHDT